MVFVAMVGDVASGMVFELDVSVRGYGWQECVKPVKKARESERGMRGRKDERQRQSRQADRQCALFCIDACISSYRGHGTPRDWSETDQATGTHGLWCVLRCGS